MHSHLDDNLKLTLLQNAASSNTHLRAAKHRADQLRSHKNDRELAHDQHYSLLLSAANSCNSQFVPAQTKSQRRVCTAEIGNHDFNQDSPSEVAEDFEHNTDAPASALLANATNRSNCSPNSYLPPEDFNSLSPQAKDAWRSLPNHLKAAITKNKSNSQSKTQSSSNLNNSNESNHRTAKPPSYASKPFTNANLHELITELIAQNNE